MLPALGSVFSAVQWLVQSSFPSWMLWRMASVWAELVLLQLSIGGALDSSSKKDHGALAEWWCCWLSFFRLGRTTTGDWDCCLTVDCLVVEVVVLEDDDLDVECGCCFWWWCWWGIDPGLPVCLPNGMNWFNCCYLSCRLEANAFAVAIWCRIHRNTRVSSVQNAR